MTALYRGVSPVLAKYRGATPIREMRRGSTLIWTAAPIFDGFDGTGWLDNWINELYSPDPAALISDQWGQLLDGLNNFVGSTVAFVQGGIDQIGQLVTYTGSSLVNAYCGAWGGTAPDGGGIGDPSVGGGVTSAPDNLLGLINGIPIIGPFITTALAAIINQIAAIPADIEHLVGTIPVVGTQFAAALGLIPDQISGVLAPPINFVVDQLGNVIGTITCGAFKPTAASIAEDIQYVIGVIEGRARMLIPDGLMSLDTRTSRYRWPTPLTSDDGFLEVRLADNGDPGMTTQVFRRYSNSGYHEGMGMDFRDNYVSLMHRTSDTDVVAAGGVATFGSGDRFRLEESGNLHTLTKNGEQVFSGNITTVKGAGTRSVGMVMQAGKELLGQRLFSPSLDYLEAA